MSLQSLVEAEAPTIIQKDRATAVVTGCVGRSLKREKNRFKSMRDTYKMNMLFLTIGMMHPTARRHREYIRFLIIGVNIVFVIIPCFIIIGNDMRVRVTAGDAANLVRQLIIIVCLIFVFIKMILSIVRGKELKEIIDTMNRDYESFNSMPADYQELAEDSIKKTKLWERIWTVVIAVTTASYPVLALVFTVYSQVASDAPRRYMVHECYIIFLSDEQRYASPYFEIFAVFCTYTVWMIFIGFTGFDGMFTVSIVHVTLKLRIISQHLTHLMDDVDDRAGIRRKIGQFVEEHCEIQKFINKIEKCFEVWLVGVFFNAVLNIGMALSQTTSKSETDINVMYYLFVGATAVHIYLPCYLAAEVTHYAAEIGKFAYGCSWEATGDVGVRRAVALIISKAQVPIRFRALGMLTYNMDLYFKILQTSYTMFTILRK